MTVDFLSHNWALTSPLTVKVTVYSTFESVLEIGRVKEYARNTWSLARCLTAFSAPSRSCQSICLSPYPPPPSLDFPKLVACPLSAGSDVGPCPPYGVVYCGYRRGPGVDGPADAWGTNQSGGAKTFTDPGQRGHCTDRPQEHQNHMPRLPVTRGLIKRICLFIHVRLSKLRNVARWDEMKLFSGD